MFGLSRDRWESGLTARVRPRPGRAARSRRPLRDVVAQRRVRCPSRSDQGVSHYTGVGIFLRPLEDLRRSEVTVRERGPGLLDPARAGHRRRGLRWGRQAGHDPTWKQAIHHDTGGSWDLEDVRDHYVQSLFGVDPRLLRRIDPERALDLGPGRGGRT